MRRFLGVAASGLGVILIALNVFFKMGESGSISVIGGAHGPTSVFVASKVGGVSSTVGIISGIALIILAFFLMVWKKK